MRIFTLTACTVLFFCATTLFGQEGTSPFQVRLSGLVKTDFFFDSRQTVSAREGHFLLFPTAPLKDLNGKDINAKPSVNLLPIQSLLSVNVTGPKIMNASTSAIIEGDFFGTTNNDVNLLRLRHAYLKLRWEKAELITGQYWHPIFVTTCFPGTVSFNTGSPIQPFARAPQIRFSYMPGHFRFSGALLSQRDYPSAGPDGPNSKYLRDSHIPEIQVFAEYNLKRNNELFIGSGFGYKNLVPQLKTGMGYATSEKVHGLNANAWMKFVSKDFTVKLEYVYLENGSEFLALSGYAIRDTLDAATGMVEYVPVRTVSYWGEIHTNGEKVQVGVFAGYSENLGTGEFTKGPFYLTSNLPVKSVYRISPRIILKRGPLSFALEVEHTAATFGATCTEGNIINTTETSNTRVLTSVIYRF